MSVIALTYFVNYGDVRMTKSRCGTRLLLEATKSFRVTAQKLRQKLQRNLSTKNGVAREVHFAHSTFTDERENLVVLYAFTDFKLFGFNEGLRCRLNCRGF